MTYANQSRLTTHIETLRKFTATPDRGVTRLTYSAEDLQARNYIKKQMESYGLSVKEDAFGNIFGKLEGTMANAPSVLIGSHFDSVPNGGAYDGTAGVVVALEVAALFQELKLQPTYPLEVVAFVEEEGSRYGGALMGSRAMTGALSYDDFTKLTDQDNVKTVDSMEEIGLKTGQKTNRSMDTIKSFLELHIEQGPILEEKNISIGVVESIVSIQQLEITIEGQAGHAGTTPMNRRADALVAASKVIAQLPTIASSISDETVITTGRLNVYPNGANVIPDRVVFSVDIRSSRKDEVLQATNQVNTIVESINENEIRTSVKNLMFIEPKALDESIRTLFKQSCDKLDISHCSIHSGAGHDAMVLADCTASGMIFVPSEKGLSHCPEEFTAMEDLVKGTDVLFEAVKALTETNHHS